MPDGNYIAMMDSMRKGDIERAGFYAACIVSTYNANRRAAARGSSVLDVQFYHRLFDVQEYFARPTRAIEGNL